MGSVGASLLTMLFKLPKLGCCVSTVESTNPGEAAGGSAGDQPGQVGEDDTRRATCAAQDMVRTLTPAPSLAGPSTGPVPKASFQERFLALRKAQRQL